MVSIYVLTALFCLHAVFVTSVMGQNQQPVIDALNFIVTNKDNAYASSMQAVRQQQKDLAQIIWRVGVAGDIRTIATAARIAVTKDYAETNRLLVRDMGWNREALADASMAWYRTLRTETHYNPLAQYNLQQLHHQIVNTLQEECAQNLREREQLSLQDLEQVLQQARRLNALALRNPQRTPQYQRALDALFASSSQLLISSRRTQWLKVDSFIDSAVIRAKRLVALTQAIQLS